MNPRKYIPRRGELCRFRQMNGDEMRKFKRKPESGRVHPVFIVYLPDEVLVQPLPPIEVASWRKIRRAEPLRVLFAMMDISPEFRGEVMGRLPFQIVTESPTGSVH